MNKKKYMPPILCVVVLLAILLFVFITFNAQSENMDKQWYLLNTGEKSNLSDAPEFKDYIPMQQGIDINASNMWSLLPEISVQHAVIVALIDTGVDVDQQDLKDAIWQNENEVADDHIDNDENGYVDDINGYNFCTNNGDVTTHKYNQSENSHGTMGAGIIAARKNNVGIVGVAGSAKVKIMSLKILESQSDVSNGGTLANLIKSIKYAEQNGAKICNLSLSIKLDDSQLRNTIKESKMLFVVSAGNGVARGVNIDVSPSYPAAYEFDNLISVANINYNGNLNKSSNYGYLSVDIAAPGTLIYSTDINNTYTYFSGTSAAAPMISGVAALMFSINQSLLPSEVKEVLCSTATKNNALTNKVFCGGFVNGYNAVKAMKGGTK